MKIICEREKFLAAFQTAAMVVPSRSPKDILKSVKLTVDEHVATLMATDLEVGVRIEIVGVTTEAPGTVLLPVERFGPILRESSDATLRIEVTSRGVEIRGERSEFKLPIARADEFPEVPTFDAGQYHEVPARLLRELIRRTLFATEPESTRYALGGVLLEFEAERIIAVGTDGRRLAKMEGPARSVNGHLPRDTMTIVPARSMLLIERALSDADGEVFVAARANDVMVRSPRAVIFSRLVEGRFPRWRDVFPVRQNVARIPMAVGPAYAAIRQASVLVNDESKGLDFKFGEGTMVVAASGSEIGQSRVEMPIAYDGPPLSIALNNKFVADFFRVLDPQMNCTIELENSESAALFTTEDGYGYVVMPLARDR